MATVLVKSSTPSLTSSSVDDGEKKEFQVHVSEQEIPPLGAVYQPKKFWFQRGGAQHDQDAIATQVSLGERSLHI
jgi:hypothetical protein